MGLTFSNLFFVKKEQFPEEKQLKHEEHHRKISWVYYCTFVLGMWLLAGPPTFGYQLQSMLWSDLISGFLMIVLSCIAFKPYKLWAQWGLVFLGVWLLIAPMLFSAKEGAAYLNDYFVGTLAVCFAIVIARQPGIKLFAQPGPDIPPGWTYNPSAWSQRVPVVFLAWLGFFIARYMGAFQLDYIHSVWDPFFGDGTRQVLTSKVSKSFPVSDSMLGAFSYIMDVLFGLAGGTPRWRTMPWVVIIFGILIVPLGVVSITLIILQPLSVGHWCTLCLSSALISLIMIPLTVDEVLATTQLLRYEVKVRKRPFWKAFWFGGTMEGGKIEEEQDPRTLLGYSVKDSFSEVFSRPWNLYLIMATGIWVMAAPDVLKYSGTLADSNHFVGAIIVTFAVISMSEVTRSLRFLNILFGLWLIGAPWFFSADVEAAKWSGVFAGIALIALCFPKGKIADKRASWDKRIV